MQHVGVVAWPARDGKFIVNSAAGRAFLQPLFAQPINGTVAQLSDVVRFNVVEFSQEDLHRDRDKFIGRVDSYEVIDPESVGLNSIIKEWSEPSRRSKVWVSAPLYFSHYDKKVGRGGCNVFRSEVIGDVYDTNHRTKNPQFGHEYIARCQFVYLNQQKDNMGWSLVFIQYYPKELLQSPPMFGFLIPNGKSTKSALFWNADATCPEESIYFVPGEVMSRCGYENLGYWTYAFMRTDEPVLGRLQLMKLETETYASDGNYLSALVCEFSGRLSANGPVLRNKVVGEVIDRSESVDWHVVHKAVKMWCRLEVSDFKNPRWEAVMTFDDNQDRPQYHNSCDYDEEFVFESGERYVYDEDMYYDDYGYCEQPSTSGRETYETAVSSMGTRMSNVRLDTPEVGTKNSTPRAVSKISPVVPQEPPADPAPHPRETLTPERDPEYEELADLVRTILSFPRMKQVAAYYDNETYKKILENLSGV